VATDRVMGERRRRRPTRTGQVLSVDLIMRTCLRLIAQHGAEALSMRRLGAALGADATAIYRYFGNKDELLLAVADELIAQSLAQFEATGDWLADLRRMALLMYRTNLANPQVAILSASRVTGREHEIRAVETLLGILRGAGFDDATAVRYYHSFVDLVLSYSALDAAAQVLGPAQAEAAVSAWHGTYGKLPPEEYPNIAASTAELLSSMPDSSFRTTLDLFLSALAATR
jgi:AcrR family transcriptional regulator